MPAAYGSRRYPGHPPDQLSPLVPRFQTLAEQMVDGRLEGIVVKQRSSAYRAGSRVGWSKVKHPSWHEREARRFRR